MEYDADEQNMEGGNSLLLHLDDWEHLERFSTDPMAYREMRWSAPPSKNTTVDVHHAVFDLDVDGKPIMDFIDQFVQPANFEEGTWLTDMSEALETSERRFRTLMETASDAIVCADKSGHIILWNQVAETIETNNTRAVSITVQ